MNKNFKVPTMMTIANIAKTFNLPEHFVRQAVLSGKTVSVKAGSKFLVNAEKFVDFLNDGELIEQTEETTLGINRIPARIGDK